MSQNIHLFPITIYGTERLAGIRLPEEQLQYVRFSASVAQYEAAGNPWCFAVDLDGHCIGYLDAESDSDGDLHINKFVIDQSYQRQGVGSAAMEEFLQMARDSMWTSFFSVSHTVILLLRDSISALGLQTQNWGWLKPAVN